MTPMPKKYVDEPGKALAEHLDAISLRARIPSPDAADEIEKIFADHEAACAELARQEGYNAIEREKAPRFR